LGSIGYNLASAAYWHPVFPYKWNLTGLSAKQLADGYTKATGRQWNQNLGSDAALFDVAIASDEEGGEPEEQDRRVERDPEAEGRYPARSISTGARGRCRT